MELHIYGIVLLIIIAANNSNRVPHLQTLRLNTSLRKIKGPWISKVVQINKYNSVCIKIEVLGATTAHLSLKSSKSSDIRTTITIHSSWEDT